MKIRSYQEMPQKYNISELESDDKDERDEMLSKNRHATVDSVIIYLLERANAMKYIILFFLLIDSARAATYTSNGSVSDVQAKINSASGGDTIIIPAGTFTWTTGVTWTGKGIKLQGAGGGRVEGSSSSPVSLGTGTKTFTIRSGSTIIGFTVGETLICHDKFVKGNTMTGTVTSWDGTTLVMNMSAYSGSSPTNFWVFESAAATVIIHNAGMSPMIEFSKTTSNSSEITGIQFKRGTGTGFGVQIDGTGKAALIHDVRFTGIHQGIRDNTVMGLVIWHFYADAGFNISTDYNNVDNAIQSVNTSVTASWTNPNTVGMNDTNGLNNVYIEDSYFVGLIGGCIDAGDNCRMVIRHCIFDNAAVEMHGQETDPIGIRQMEAYKNLFIFNVPANPATQYPGNLNYWFEWRGGSGIVTNNVMDQITSQDWGSKPDVKLECQSINRLPTCWSPYGWNGAYPAGHQVGQGSNGLANSATLTNNVYNTVNPYVEGVFFYGNTAAVGCSTDQYTPDGVGLGLLVTTYIQQNRDYFLTAPTTGLAYNGWTPYTYPHPLRTVISDTTKTSVQIYNNGIPIQTTLLQNYPNPFNPATIIRYRLSTLGFVKLSTKVSQLLKY